MRRTQMDDQRFINPSIELSRATWQRSTAPRFGILQDLAKRLLGEISTLQRPEDMIRMGEGFSLDEQMHKIEIDLIRRALSMTSGRQREAAALLGVKPTTLNMKIKRLGINLPRPRLSKGRAG